MILKPLKNIFKGTVTDIEKQGSYLYQFVYELPISNWEKIYQYMLKDAKSKKLTHLVGIYLHLKWTVKNSILLLYPAHLPPTGAC